MTIPNNDVTSTIQLALAPVFLLTAVVMLINAISGRLARTVDRMRFIHNELLAAEKLTPSLESHYRVEFREVRIRGRMCAIAIFFDVLSGVLISLTVLEIFFFEAGVRHFQGSYVVTTFVAGLIFFMTALVVVLVELVYAHRSVGWDLPSHPDEKA
ncbi:MAG: DUF2721 domain-containing protein [Verrucomicrobiota bacterium]